MDRQRIYQKTASGKLASIGIVLVLLTGVLVEGTQVRRLIGYVVPRSADMALDGLTAAWWCLAAWFGASLVKHVLRRIVFPVDGQPRRRKLLSDLVSGLIYLGAVFGILKFSFHQPVAGLLATSGVVAVVLGLALQSTLADLFSGIALNIESPFRAGDWIAVDGANEGQVLEINWRATRIRDRNGDLVIIPNSQIAKSRVTNHSLPEKAHPGSIVLEFSAETSADKIDAILVPAVLKATHVLHDPAPAIAVQEIRGRIVVYCVSFYVADFEDMPAAQNEVSEQVLSCLSSAGLQLARPQTDVFVVRDLKPATTMPRG